MIFRSIRTNGRLLAATCLALCSFMASSCDSGKGGNPESSKFVPQQFSGTLQVRILPDNPTSWHDLQAMYSGEKGVSYSWEKNGATLASEKTDKLSRKNLAKGDRISVTVRAGNETGSATVVIGNAPPQVLSIALEPAVVYTGVDLTAKPNAVDPDGDEIRYNYQWAINDRETTDNGPVLKGDRFKKGDRITLAVTPSDGADQGSPYKVTVATIRNTPPFFTSSPPENFMASQYTYSVTAKDLDGDKITYSLASAPKGMTIDPDSGVVTWRISAEDSGAHEVEIVASDSDGARSTQKYSLDIRQNNGINQ
jgi:hypothetical protein